MHSLHLVLLFAVDRTEGEVEGGGAGLTTDLSVATLLRISVALFHKKTPNSVWL